MYVGSYSNTFSKVVFRCLRTHFNINNTPYNLLLSHLSDRFQKIKINNALSENFNLSGGVPQECAKNVGISHIYNITNYHLQSMYNYANDMQIRLSFQFQSDFFAKEAIIEIENCIAELLECMFLLNFMFKYRKTEILLIGTKQILNKLNMDAINVKIGNTYIRPVEQAKNLGIILIETCQHTSTVSHRNHFTPLHVKTIKIVY